jgi:BASS family bile acid:Na+ symporter
VLALPSVLSVLEPMTVVAVVVLTLSALGAGHVMGGPAPRKSIVLAIACANRNPGIAISIAAANYPAESFGATVLLYVLVVGIASRPYLSYVQRRLAARAATQPT